MTKTELKYKVIDTGSSFFDRSSMKFFGDTMANYGCRDGDKIDTYSEKGIKVWELYRRHAVKHGLNDSAYFRKDNFQRVIAK